MVIDIASILILIAIYFIPTFAAFEYNHAAKGRIFALNLLLGWTVVVWFYALIQAMTAVDHHETAI